MINPSRFISFYFIENETAFQGRDPGISKGIRLEKITAIRIPGSPVGGEIY